MPSYCFLFPYHRLGTLFGHMVNDKHLRKEEQVRKDLIKACKVCISLGHFYTAWVWFCLNLWPPFSPLNIDHPVFHRICSAVKTPFTWWWFSLLAAWPYITKLPHNSWPAITFSSWSFVKRASICVGWSIYGRASWPRIHFAWGGSHTNTSWITIDDQRTVNVFLKWSDFVISASCVLDPEKSPKMQNISWHASRST